MEPQSQCLCVTLDKRESTLAVSQGDTPIVSVSEEWLYDRVASDPKLAFELVHALMGKFKVSVLVEVLP